MKKGLMIGLLVIVLVVVGGVLLFLANLDDLVKTAVEEGGSRATQVDVTLAKAEVKPAEGRAALSGLIVGNPAGFKSGSAFELGQISVTLDTGAVTKDVVVIKEVVVQSPRVTYELGANGSNIDAIRKNVEQFAGGSGASGGETGGGEGPKVIIEHLYVRDGKVGISASALGGKTMDASLPEIHLTDIGKDKGGATPGEVAGTLMAALTERVGGFVKGLDISSVFEGMTNVPESLKGMAGGAAQKAQDALKSVTGGDAAKGAGDAVKGAGDAVKKLFSK